MRKVRRLLGLILTIVLVQALSAQEGETIHLPVTLRLDREYVPLQNSFLKLSYHAAESSTESNRRALDTMKETWSAVKDLDAERYESLTAASEKCDCKGISPSLAQMNAGISDCSEFRFLGSIDATPVRLGYLQILCDNEQKKTVSTPVIESVDRVGHCPSIYFTPEFTLLKISVGAEKGLHNSTENIANNPNGFLEVPLKFCEEQKTFIKLLLPIGDDDDPKIKEVREWYLETELLLHNIDYAELYESRQLQEFKARHNVKGSLLSGFLGGLNELELKRFIEQQKKVNPNVVAIFDMGDVYVLLHDSADPNSRWNSTLIRRKENKLVINSRVTSTPIEEVILKSDVVNEFLLSKCPDGRCGE